MFDKDMRPFRPISHRKRRPLVTDKFDRWKLFGCGRLCGTKSEHVYEEKKKPTEYDYDRATKEDCHARRVSYDIYRTGP